MKKIRKDRHFLLRMAGFEPEEVEKFVKAMKLALLTHYHKGRSWEEAHEEYLKGKLCEEVGEYLKSNSPLELPDIANMCMMLYLRSGI